MAANTLSPALRQDLISGVARALAEHQRMFLFRLEERLMPYQPTDPLFRHADSTALEVGIARAPIRSPQLIGPTMGELRDRYLIAKRKSWTAKTHASRTRQLSFLVEHVGESVPAAAVTKKDLRAYRDALVRLRSNHHVGAGKSFAARQTDDLSKRIAAKTAGLIFEVAQAFFRWARADGYVSENPSDGIRVEMPKLAKTHKARRPFNSVELTRLFKAPVFQGCKSAGRRFEPGAVKMRDAYYWIPVLAYLTGARLGELVQLHVLDVHLDGPTPYIEITDANGGALGTGDEKHVKSAAGVRRVPIHPALVELNFPEFVTKRAADKRASKRLFFEVAYGADGQASTVFSKWFGRLLNKVGLSDPALVFHSFRHNAEDALRNALQPQYVIDRVIGHSDSATSALYGEGASLEVAAAAVKAMKLPVDVCSILLPASANG